MAELVRKSRNIPMSEGTNKDKVTRIIETDKQKKFLIQRRKNLTEYEQKKYSTIGFTQPGYSGKRELKRGGKNE